MKNFLIVIFVIVVLSALAYLIVKANKPVAPPIVEVTTPPATIVQPVYVQQRRSHDHNNNV